MTKRGSVRVAWIFSIIGIVTTPVLLFFELVMWFLAAMIGAEPSNTDVVRVLFVMIVVAIALAALVCPLIAIFSQRATGPLVIAGITLAGWLVAQLFFVGMAVGVCSLEGCFPA
jgi:hypothetical protein